MSPWVDRGTHRTSHKAVHLRPSDVAVGRLDAVAAVVAAAAAAVVVVVAAVGDYWAAAEVAGVAGARDALTPDYRHCLKPGDKRKNIYIKQKSNTTKRSV